MNVPGTPTGSTRRPYVPLEVRWQPRTPYGGDAALRDAEAWELSEVFFRSFHAGTRWQLSYRELLKNPAFGEAQALASSRVILAMAQCWTSGGAADSSIGEIVSYLRRLAERFDLPEVADQLVDLALDDSQTEGALMRCMLAGAVTSFPSVSSERDAQLLRRFEKDLPAVVAHDPVNIEDRDCAMMQALAHPSFSRDLLLSLLKGETFDSMPEIIVDIPRWAGDAEVMRALLPHAEGYALKRLAEVSKGALLIEALRRLADDFPKGAIAVLEALDSSRGVAHEDLLPLLQHEDAALRMATILAGARLSPAGVENIVTPSSLPAPIRT